jgi:hypothetical protein
MQLKRGFACAAQPVCGGACLPGKNGKGRARALFTPRWELGDKMLPYRVTEFFRSSVSLP